MGFLIDEKQFINDNIFQYENKMNSQYSRFIDKAPNFCWYYHINNIESTADNGFQNIERVLGDDSPLRYQEIKDFPIYGLDQVLLDLNDEDQGLDSSFDGDAVILPNTIKPLPNDFFILNYLDKNYLFMVTSIAYDTIKSNNYYKINYTLRSLTEDYKNSLLKQTDEKYNCILQNIGTEEKCLIREDEIGKLIALNEVYTNIITRYKLLFYHNLYNSFIYNDGVTILYDRFLSHFINNGMLFNEKYNYSSLILSIEDKSNTFLYDYETSIYRIIEMNRKDMLNYIKYNPNYLVDQTSVFNFYRIKNILSIGFNNGLVSYIDDSLIDNIKNNIHAENESIIDKLIIDYFNNSVNTIYDLNVDRLKNYDYISYSFNSFIMIPMILFILRYYYSKFMSIK